MNFFARHRIQNQRLFENGVYFIKSDFFFYLRVFLKFARRKKKEKEKKGDKDKVKVLQRSFFLLP